MSNKIDIAGIDKSFFGKKMPSVGVSKIEIDNSPTDSKVIVRTYIDIKFSKPAHVQGGTVKEALKDLDLFLYSYLTYEDYIKINFDQNKFSIDSWFTTDRFRSSSSYRSLCFHKIAISTLVGSSGHAIPGVYGTPELIKLNVFDKDGDEVIQISGLAIEHKYQSSLGDPDTGEGRVPSLADVSSLMYFAFIGPDNLNFFSNRFNTDGLLFEETVTESTLARADESATEPYNSPYGSLTANSYYGDITYVHVLEKNKVASKFYEAYITPDGRIYQDEVLQSVNGKFFTTENVSFETIKSRMQALIEEYKIERESDADLNNNISNLEQIIYAGNNEVGVLGEFANYRSTYPHKNPALASGRFYNAFVVAFSEIIESVNAETELSTRVLYDSLVQDLRSGGMSLIYSPPSYGIELVETHRKRGVPYAAEGVPVGDNLGDPSDAYLSKKWFVYSRQALATSNLNFIDDASIQDIYGLTPEQRAEKMGIGDDAPAFNDYFKDEFGEVMGENVRDLIYKKYLEAGYSQWVAAQLADDALYQAFEDMDSTIGTSTATSVGSSMEAISLFLDAYDRPDIGVATSAAEQAMADRFLPSVRTGDIKVMNKGIFFFDYEKALRTQSKISRVLDLTKLQQLFRFQVPYSHFYVEKAELSRNETRMDKDFTGERDKNYIRCKITLLMETPTEHGGLEEDIDYPKNVDNTISYIGGLEIGSGAGAVGKFAADKIRYLTPQAYLTQTTRVTSFLAFVNFDFPVTKPEDRLEEFNNLDDHAATGRPLFEEDAAHKVYDGYRMMAFKFRDIMDDDVAISNTLDPSKIPFDYTGRGDSISVEERTARIRASNTLDVETTCYGTLIETVDATHLTYKKFALMMTQYFNLFEDYYTRAAQICSYNNITNEFNTFFKSSMLEEFPDKPWETAAYVAHALSALLSPNPVNDTIMYERIRQSMSAIGPEQGTLGELSAFASDYRSLVRLLVPDLSVTSEEDVAGTAAPAGGTPYDGMNALKFDESVRMQYYNEIPIDQVVAGMLIHDSTTINDFEEFTVPPPLYYPTIPENTVNYENFPEYSSESFERSKPYGTAHAVTSGATIGPTEVDASYGLEIYTLDDYQNINKLRFIELFELVFMPLNRNDINTIKFNYLELLQVYLNPSDYTDSAKESILAAAKGVQTEPYDILKAPTLSGGISYAAYLLNRLLRYTTADNMIVNTDEASSRHYAMRRPTTPEKSGFSKEDFPSSLRKFRQLSPTYILLERMHYAVNMPRESTIEAIGDAVPLRNFAGYGAETGTGDGTDPLVGSNLGGTRTEPGSLYYPYDAWATDGSSGWSTRDESYFSHNYLLDAITATTTDIPTDFTMSGDPVAPSTKSIFDEIDSIRVASRYTTSKEELMKVIFAVGAATMMDALRRVVQAYTYRGIDGSYDAAEMRSRDNYKIMHLFNSDDPVGPSRDEYVIGSDYLDDTAAADGFKDDGPIGGY